MARIEWWPFAPSHNQLDYIRFTGVTARTLLLLFLVGNEKITISFLFFLSPPSSVRDVNKLFNQFLNVKRKAPGDPGPIFNLVEAQTRVNAPVALYIYLSGLWDPPFERRNKSNMQQAYIHGVDSGSYIWSPGSADESLGIKWHQGEGEEDEDEITKWNCMDTSLQYSITTMPLTAENW
jgi:hypothetical protein